MDRVRGCLYGLAAGDSLGAPIEFLTKHEIKKSYGENGLTEYKAFNGLSEGSITDDTQLSLITLEYFNKESDAELKKQYFQWLKYQKAENFIRAPGNATIEAMETNTPVKEAKGSGGMMRTGVLGLILEPDEAYLLGKENARLTHDDIEGYTTAGFMSVLISYLNMGKPLYDSISNTITTISKYQETKMCNLVANSVLYDYMNKHQAKDYDGWLAYDILKASLHIALNNESDFSKGIIDAANISGDSDTVASIVGSILGTRLGFSAIEEKWILKIECKKKIEDIINLKF